MAGLPTMTIGHRPNANLYAGWYYPAARAIDSSVCVEPLVSDWFRARDYPTNPVHTNQPFALPVLPI
jgi:hypothetical protein